MKETDSSVLFNLPNAFKVKISPNGEPETVEISRNNIRINKFTAGLVDVPLNATRSTLKEPIIIPGILTIGVDGVVEIKTSPNPSFYFPIGGGILLVDTNIVWLRGNIQPIAFAELPVNKQDTIRMLTDYLKQPPPTGKNLSNYYPEEFGLQRDSDTSCCCNGTGQLTLAMVSPKFDGDSQYIKDIIAEFSEEEKKCIKFQYVDHTVGCLEKLAKELSTEYNNQFNNAHNNYCGHIKVIGHSAGGVIAAKAANSMDEADIYSIASPLNGVGEAHGILGFLWDESYFVGLGYAADGLLNLIGGCLMTEVGHGGQNFPPLIASNFTAHASNSTYTFPISSQTAGPQGSSDPVYHPGTDHDSVLPAALHDILKGTSCCGNFRIDPEEECDPPKRQCVTNPDGKPGRCTDKCRCKPLCGNKKIDPGEQCDTTSQNCPLPNQSRCKADCTCLSLVAASPVVPMAISDECGENADPECKHPNDQCKKVPSGSGTCNAECKCIDNCVAGNCQDSSQREQSPR